jgi:hypothetical protein
MDQKPWFKAKTYGWGWQPATWQAWLVMLVWLAVEIGCIWYLNSLYGATSQFALGVVGCSIVATSILVVIAYVTGEKPGWKWGDKK